MGLSTVGFINPTLYANPNMFNDIISGNNNCCAPQDNLNPPQCCLSGFSASSGWDPTTGLGSINYTNLAKILIPSSNQVSSSSNNNNNDIQLTSGDVAGIIIAVIIIFIILNFLIYLTLNETNGIFKNEVVKNIHVDTNNDDHMNIAVENPILKDRPIVL